MVVMQISFTLSLSALYDLFCIDEPEQTETYAFIYFHNVTADVHTGSDHFFDIINCEGLLRLNPFPKETGEQFRDNRKATKHAFNASKDHLVPHKIKIDIDQQIKQNETVFINRCWSPLMPMCQYFVADVTDKKEGLTLADGP